MKGLLVVFFAIFLMLCVAYVYELYQDKKAKWEIKYVDTQGFNEVWLVKRKQAEFIGRAKRNDMSYADKLLALQSAAEDQMYSWNSAESVVKRLRRG